MKRATNWDLYFQRQMGDPEMKGLIEEELKALRIGAELAKIRQPRSEPDSRNDGETVRSPRLRSVGQVPATSYSGQGASGRKSIVAADHDHDEGGHSRVRLHRHAVGPGR